MSCPYLKEVVMLFCRACAVKKMVPLDRIASASPCLTHDFESCPFYREVMAKLVNQGSESPVAPVSRSDRTEVSR
jgi:hypothetical protein